MHQKPPIGIIGVPSDLGANIRGSCMGPAAIRIARLKNKIENMGHSVCDFGDIPVPIRDSLNETASKEKFLPQILALCELLHQKTLEVLEAGLLPVTIGGDHSIAIGSLAGVAQHYQKKNEKIGLLWVDAHADFNTPASSPSGNIHGMPLALATGLGFDTLTGLGSHKVKVDAENIALIGIRTIDDNERKLLRASGIAYYTMRTLDERGMSVIMKEAIARISKNTSAIHLSFDLDAMDPAHAPGVSTPESGGLSLREAHLLLEMLHETQKISSMDFVELNPYHDLGSQTANLTVDLIESALGKSII